MIRNLGIEIVLFLVSLLVSFSLVSAFAALVFPAPWATVVVAFGGFLLGVEVVSKARRAGPALPPFACVLRLVALPLLAAGLNQPL